MIPNRRNLAGFAAARDGGEIVPFPGPGGPKRGRPQGRGPTPDPSWRKWLRALRQHGLRLAVVAVGLAAILWALNGFGTF